MTLLLPRQIGNIKVLERLGEGGMAFVHRAEDVFRPERALAIKFLRPEAQSDAKLVRRFLQEGEVLRKLRHPNLVEVADYGRAGSTPFLLMELLPGGSIKECMGEAPAMVMRRLIPVLEALQVAHRAGVIHRDLKPSNLLFGTGGQLKVTDFGVCLLEGSDATRTTQSQMVVGTVGYMAPEQHGDPRKVDARCDVYAMGAILYEFTTGFSYSQVQMPPAVVRPGFPPRLARILMQTLAADPRRRTASMEILGGELSQWLESAEAAGWGEERLPGFDWGQAEVATQARARSEAEETASSRLGPYLDALRTGGVGTRRAAAEGILSACNPSDETFLLEALAQAPEAIRFALVTALGAVAGAGALESLLALLEDPFSQREAVEALSLIALRTGRAEEVLFHMQEAVLGQPWKWKARARLGDATWVQALGREWPGLSLPQRITAVEAVQELPAPLRLQARSHLKGAERAGGTLQKLFESLQGA
jgi:hypothetical protein